MKKVVALAALAAPLAVITPAKADVIQLGFILDRSGSIGSGNWATIVNGLSSAITAHIPVGGTTQYEITVVTFDESASTDIDSYLVTDATSRANLATSIAGLTSVYNGGTTNYTAAFQAMLNALTGGAGVTPGTAAASYVNFATDGDPNPNSADGITERNALITAGIDNISIEGIGAGLTPAFLQDNICYPGPCDNTVPFNFPGNGFYLAVADANAYAAAIGGKIQVITGVPEPATLALLGLGLAGLGFARRRRQAA